MAGVSSSEAVMRVPIIRIKKFASIKNWPTKASRKEYPYDFLVKQGLLDLPSNEEPLWVVSMVDFSGDVTVKQEPFEEPSEELSEEPSNAQLVMAESSDVVVKQEPADDPWSEFSSSTTAFPGEVSEDAYPVTAASGTVENKVFEDVKAAEGVKGARHYKCGVCDRAFTMVGLRRHMASHARPFVCGECDHAFTSVDNLRRHELTVHTEARFACNVCSREVTTRSRLKKHMLERHGEPRWRCDACPKVFASASNLRQHSAVHTGERPHACRHCGERFRFHDGRSRHERAAHASV